MSSSVGFRSERGPLLIALMLSTGLVAIDSTILATAVPSIVSSVGGFSSFPWLFSIYVLAQAVTVPVYGKLADLFGRKPVILFGMSLFLAGSMLCGLAWSMGALIAFRVVQGLGAGAVAPMTLTIAGDVYSIAERAKVQGYIASVWAVSSVIGPTLGGLFSEYLSWRWIFFVNVPLCILAAAMIMRNFKETVERRRPKIDYLGAILLTVGSGLVILGVLEGDESWPWASVAGIAIPVAGVVLLIAFVFAEKRAAEPVLPLWIFRRRLLITTNVAAACTGAVLLGLSSYVPTFVQDVLGTGPLVAGLAVGAITLGWPVSGSQAGRVYTRIGFRSCATIGIVIALIGCVLLTQLDASSSVWLVAADCFVLGLGLGFTGTPTVIAAQSSVEWSERGVVTGANQFFRSAGSAVGVAVFGAIANATIGHNAHPAHPGGAVRAAIALGTHHVFIGVLVTAVILTVAVLLMPKGLRRPAAAQAAARESAETVSQ